MSRKSIILAIILSVVSATGSAVTDTIHGQIGGLSNQFNEDIGNVPGNRYQGSLTFDYFYNRPTELERRFNLSALVNDEGLALYSVQEAYIAKEFNSKDYIKVGRQILPWSTIDAVWGFGKLNNRQNFDFFEPSQEGLIGIQYQRKSSNGMRYRFFGSGLYVPEMNPGLDINKKERTITSRHPWADAPAPTAQVEGQDKTIQYIVDYPEIQEVIYRYTIGANIGWENKHWVVDGFVLRKPENQISQQVEVAYNAGDDVVKAFITPQFYFHDVYGGNLRYRNLDLEMFVSGIAIRPNTFPDGSDQATRFTEIKTEKKREDYLGGGISKINDVYGIGAGYVARLSPFDRERDSLAQDPRWNQAVNGFVMRSFGPHYKVAADIKYDMLTTDRLVMLRAYYNPSKEIQMHFGVNMIGTPNDGESYWSPFTNNDALYGGLRYIF